MKVVRLSFPDFCIEIPGSHDPIYRSVRYFDCIIATSPTMYAPASIPFTKGNAVQHFTQKMFDFQRTAKAIRGNIIMKETIQAFKKSDIIYIIDLDGGAKMICNNLSKFSKLSNPIGDAVVCYTLLGIILFK